MTKGGKEYTRVPKGQESENTHIRLEEYEAEGHAIKRDFVSP